MRTNIVLLVLLGGMWSARAAPAAPVLWESNLGAPLAYLTGQDTAVETVALSFSFPFATAGYDSVSVSTDGYLNLGSPASYPFADPIAADLLGSTAPLIAPFFADLDLIQQGTVYFNDLGDRAVFTWQGVGSWARPDQSFTFQSILHRDGSIVLSYDGIPNTLETLDTNLLIGVSPGNGASDPGETAFWSAQRLMTGPTVYQMFEQGSERFDFDGRSLLLRPAGSAFRVTAIPEPSSTMTVSGGLAGLLAAAHLRLRRGRILRSGLPLQ